LIVKLNGTTIFGAVAYKTITNYQQITSGTYMLDIMTPASNNTLLHETVTFAGGFAYSIFIEGYVAALKTMVEEDYVPPSVGQLRFLHASSNTPASDFLANGTAIFRNVQFESGTVYQTLGEGLTVVRVVSTNDVFTTFVTESIHVTLNVDQTVVLVGNLNTTHNQTSTLTNLVIVDDNTLPAVGDVKIRFIHASPNAPALEIRANGVSLFSGVSFKNYTTYRTLDADIYNVDIYVGGEAAAVLSSRLDLRVSSGSAVYTLVAEGVYGQSMKIISFLDNGQTPPHDASSTNPAQGGGLSPVAIGLIVAGVILFVIAVGAGGFLYYRRRKLVGYSEIPTKE